MRRTTILVLSLVCGLLLMACTKTETTNNSNTAVVTSTPASATTPAAGTTAATGDNIGVPECDDFITKYDACVSNKVPEVVRAQYKDAIARWRSEWRRMANDPNTRGQLAAACKQAAEQQAAALKSFGCTF